MTKKSLEMKLNELCKKDLASCTYEELNTALLEIVNEESAKHVKPVNKRKLYYISAEFLIGKLLSNNLINLGLYDTVKELLEENGKTYEARTNQLNLFDLDTIDETIIKEGISFDKTDIEKNLTLFLYPDDSDDGGRKLRIYQQYLMVSAGAQMILEECKKRGSNLYDLADYAAIQINDTHPSMVIPELIRLLEEEGIKFEEAVEIVNDVYAYTNHTILAEALEKLSAFINNESILRKLISIKRNNKVAFS